MQNLRAYFILYVIAINWIIYVQEKIELSSILQRPKFDSTKISVHRFLAGRIKQQLKNCKNS